MSSSIVIPQSELTFRATRAGGPGGQHVNKSSTRIELLWNLDRSSAVSEQQRARLREKLAGRLDAEGNIRVVASASRSQMRNRQDAERRLLAIVLKALHVPRPRRKTRPTRASVEARLASKRRRALIKRSRRDGED